MTLQSRRLRSLALSASLMAVLLCPLPACSQESGNLRDDTARRLLEALDERGMPDVSLWLLNRLAQPESGISAELRSELEYRKALALVGVGHAEPSLKKRRQMFEQAQQAIDAFLASPLPETVLPDGADEIDNLAAEMSAIDYSARRINAHIQQGKLRQERGRLLQAETARRGKAGLPALPEEEGSFAAASVFKEAVVSFRAAEQLITSSPIASVGDQAKPDADVGEHDSLLARVRTTIEEVDAALGERRPRSNRGGRSRAEAARLLREWQSGLAERQDRFRNKLLEVRLLLGEGLYEVAMAFEAGSAEWKAALQESIAVDEQMYEKYRTLLAGQYARVSQGRSEAVIAKSMPVESDAAPGQSARDKQFTKALGTLADVLSLPGGGAIDSLRAKAYNVSLECWLEMLPDDAYARFDGLDESGVGLALTGGGPPESLDADWLGFKYRTALLLSRVLAASQATQGQRNPLVSNADRTIRQLALAVAKANRDFADEARELLAASGDIAVVEDFATLMDQAGVAINAMQSVAAPEEKAAARNDAIAAIRAALPLADENEIAERNRARYTLTFLLYDGEKLLDAAAMGEFLAIWYPNAPGSVQAARIAMASWQKLSATVPAPLAAEARRRCGTVAERILDTWPEDPVSRDAAAIAISAVAAADPVRIFEVINKIPQTWRGSDTALRAGIAAWKAIASLQSEGDARQTVHDELATWKQQAAELLDRGLAELPEDQAVSGLAVAAALARCQIAIASSDIATATQVLEHPQFGPWTIVTEDSQRAGAAEGMVGDILEIALQLFIQTEQIAKVEAAMKKLEAVATDPARLTATYLRLGRELQTQLQQIASTAADGRLDAESRRRASVILAGFEQFLDALASRRTDVPIQLWVATTYLELGSARFGDNAVAGVGTVVPKTKADDYLARAAASYEALLEANSEETKRYEPSIRFKLAEVYRAIGKFDSALENMAWILGDEKRVNWIDGQFEAARILQQAGEMADDASTANRLLTDAIVGRSDGPARFWGWGGLAQRLSRKAVVPSDGDEAAHTAANQFFQARLELARCRKAIAERAPAARDDFLAKAERDIAVTYRLYPELGGREMRTAFDSLLKQIQEELGQPAEGLAAIEGVAVPQGT